MARHAIVMAAGEGRRLRPLTEHHAKPVLPIDGRPVIATLLHELAAAGVARVTIVTGHLAAQVEALLGDGSAFGLALHYVRQERPEGSADAVRAALGGGAPLPALVLGADTVFTEGDIGRFAAAFATSNAAGAVAGRRAPSPSPPHRYGLRIEGGRVTRVLDDDPANELAGAPLWALDRRLAPCLEHLPGPPYELAGAVQRAVDEGLEVLGVEIGPTRDLTHPLDLVTENFAYLRGL